MRYVSPSIVIDKACTRWPDKSPSMRANAIVWFNEIARDIVDQPRDWQLLFLEYETPIGFWETVDIPGAFKIPPELAVIPYLHSIEANNVVMVNPDDRIDENPNSATDDEPPVSFYLNPVFGTGLFIPGAIPLDDYGQQLNATATYNVNRSNGYQMEEYTDTDVDTIFRIEFEPLFITGVRAAYYDMDKDGRYSKEEAKYDFEMRKLKEIDNRMKSIPATQPHGYTRVSA